MKKKSISQNLAIYKYFTPYSIISTLVLLLSITGIGYPTWNYLTGIPGLFDDFLNPIINANSRPLLNPSILLDPNFNSPFTPLNIYFFQILGVFAFKPQYAFTTTVIIFLMMLVFMESKKLINLRASILITLSYPMLFAFSRGNMSIFVFYLFLCALNFIKENKITKASVFIGFMASYQLPYAVFFLIIIVSVEKWFKPVLLGFLTTCSMYLLPFTINGFSSSLKTFTELNKRWVKTYLNTDEGLLHGTSIFGMLKSVVYIFCDFFNQPKPNVPLTLFSILSAIILFSSLILTIQPKNFILWKIRSTNESIRIILSLELAIVFVLIPQVSGFYKAIFILPFFILYAQRFNDKTTILIFYAFLIPKDFIHFTFNWYQPGVTVSSIINPCLLLAIIFRLGVRTNEIRKDNLKKFSKS